MRASWVELQCDCGREAFQLDRMTGIQLGTEVSTGSDSDWVTLGAQETERIELASE